MSHQPSSRVLVRRQRSILNDQDPDPMWVAAVLQIHTGNPRYSPIGVKRSGTKGTAAPALYQRWPLNVSHTPPLPLGRAIVSMRVRVGCVGSGMSLAAGAA